MNAQFYKVVGNQHSGTIWLSGCCVSPTTIVAGQGCTPLSEVSDRPARLVNYLNQNVLIRLLHTVIHLVGKPYKLVPCVGLVDQTY